MFKIIMNRNGIEVQNDKHNAYLKQKMRNEEHTITKFDTYEEFHYACSNGEPTKCSQLFYWGSKNRSKSKNRWNYACI